MEQNNATDTIVAVATPRGRGGIGIVRVSGSKAIDVAKQILGRVPKIKTAEYLPFLDKNGVQLDKGIALYFKSPYSFTGEDVLELQGHGGPIVMDCLLKEIVSLGARIAQPGEFTLRAFLNNKIDLVQAEAISDLINASTEEAARGAMRSLQGDFSILIESIVQALIKLRMHTEAAIDFPEEEIDFLSDGRIEQSLKEIICKIDEVSAQVRQAALMTEGIKVVIAGLPNAGKSSLLNRLAGFEAAIVTDIPGTTRDVLREHISIDGLLVQFIDTAGLRVGGDRVEEEGIKRAMQEISQADHVVWVVDASVLAKENIALDDVMMGELDSETPFSEWQRHIPAETGKIIFYNKIDKLGILPRVEKKQNHTAVYASAKTGEGIKAFLVEIKETVGFSETEEGNFVARRRHLEAVLKAKSHLLEGERQLKAFKAGELLAEELRQAQLSLELITGRFTSDDLLGKIFSEFCIGK